MNGMRWISCFTRSILVLGFAVAAAASVSGSDVTEYQVKAAFIYKFCLYVDWPAAQFNEAGAPLVLGVAGSEELLREVVAATRERMIDGRRIEVRPIRRPEDIQGLHVLFIGRSESARASALIAATDLQAIVVVTDSPVELFGSVINFAMLDNRVRFDVDLAAAEQRGLGLSAQLLKAARAVRRGDGS